MNPHMQRAERSREELEAENADLRARLAEAAETLEAIRRGAVDAIVVGLAGAEQVYTLLGADEPYRIIVEQMKEGALSVTPEGTILYANAQVENLLGVPIARVVGARLHTFGPEESRKELQAMLAVQRGDTRRIETVLLNSEGKTVPVSFTATPIEFEGTRCISLVVVDQTEQRRNDKIAADERLARAILERVGEAVVVLDPAGRITRANNAAHALAGQNVLFANLDEVFPIAAGTGPENDISAHISAALDRKETQRGIEVNLGRADGTSATVLVSAGPLVSDDQNVIGGVVTLTDISFRKRAELELRVANERFTVAAKAIKGFVYDADLVTGHVECCGRVSDVIGEILVPDFAWWRSRIHPDDRPGIDAQHEASMNSGAEEQELEYRVRHRGGHYIHVWDRSVLIRDAQGCALRAIGTVADVTDRKRMEDALRASEARTRRLIDANVVGVITATMHELKEANDIFLRMIGKTRNDLAAGTIDWVKITPPEHLDRDWRALEELRKRGTCTPFEKDYIRADGTRVPILIGAAALSFDPLEWICFVVDLTELKQSQRQLEIANAALQQTNEELQRFAYAASHDLQEPLRTIGAMSELIAKQHKGRLGADTDQLLEHIHNGVTRMSRLISDLLEYARVANDNTAPESVVDSRALATFALSNLQQRIADTNAKIIIDNLPEVLGDDQLMRVFQNLVGNALKYRREAAPEIHISARRKGLEWIFEVRDNGIGFDMRYAERVFQAFQRLHGRNEYAGTGIGLAITKRIIERHGGRIWVESTPGQGSTFYFSLPAILGIPAKVNAQSES